MIKQQLAQQQQQKLSPLQIQQIKMLELTSLEIENRINQELEENPALEEASENPEPGEEGASDEFGNKEETNITEDEITMGDYLTEDDVPDYKLRQYNRGRGEQREEIPYSEAQSLQEYLMDQLQLKPLTPKQLQIGEYLLGNIDSDGYMRRNPEDISDDMAFQIGMDVPVSEITEVWTAIKELDPAGIGAADLQECLLLQITRKEKTPVRELAITILDKYFEAFSKHQYDKIIRPLNITEDELKEVVAEIVLLNPKPGSSWESTMETKMSHIVPDFIVEAMNGELIFNMPEPYIPELRVNREYGNMLSYYIHEKDDPAQSKKEVLTFVKQKLDSAKWFIDAIKQRSTTLRKTMLAIVQIQREFFLTGDETKIKPMILKDVSEICGYDISTISRVSNSKYVQTNWSVYPLKYFFSESLINEEGEDVSSREIKAVLRSCIKEEDKSNPLPDDVLVKELKKKGYNIARRTVAKYREQLNIPIARLRKEI
ncbi:RNA polymerase sigma-54 factor [Bacteroidia bacterium]|nr:RNA polymerase sigma-54 factor [Bacteroidia bacterium]